VHPPQAAFRSSGSILAICLLSLADFSACHKS
jgi:hypothetical protein